MEAAALLLVAAASILLAVAALHDIAVRTVPNALAGTIALLGAAAQLAAGTLLYGAPAAFAVFVAAAFAWRRRWMGGGDVKLLAAAALVVPPPMVPSLLMAVALAGGLLALPYVLARRRLPPAPPGRPHGFIPRALRAERWRMRRGGPMPYAVAIASGAVFALTHGTIP